MLNSSKVLRNPVTCRSDDEVDFDDKEGPDTALFLGTGGGLGIDIDIIVSCGSPTKARTLIGQIKR